VRSVDKMRWIRVLVFAAIYFFLCVISVVFFMIKSYSGSSELTWYLQNPWIALRTIFGFILSELPRSPLLMFTLFTLILNSLILGFITDWVFRILKRYILLRKRKRRTEFKPTENLTEPENQMLNKSKQLTD